MHSTTQKLCSARISLPRCLAPRVPILVVHRSGCGSSSSSISSGSRAGGSSTVTWARKGNAAPPAPDAAPKGKGFGKVVTAPTNPDMGCPCGSMKFYRDCCQTYHSGTTIPEDAQAMLRARFSSYKKKQVSYLLASDKRPDMVAEQLKKDYLTSCEGYDYSALTVLEVEQEEGSSKAAVTFSYKSVKKVVNDQTNRRGGFQKGAVDQHLDGAKKVYINKEKSVFERQPDSGLWTLVKSEILEAPVTIADAAKAKSEVLETPVTPATAV